MTAPSNWKVMEDTNKKVLRQWEISLNAIVYFALRFEDANKHFVDDLKTGKGPRDVTSQAKIKQIMR